MDRDSVKAAILGLVGALSAASCAETPGSNEAAADGGSHVGAACFPTPNDLGGAMWDGAKAGIAITEARERFLLTSTEFAPLAEAAEEGVADKVYTYEDAKASFDAFWTFFPKTVDEYADCTFCELKAEVSHPKYDESLEQIGTPEFEVTCDRPGWDPGWCEDVSYFLGALKLQGCWKALAGSESW